MLRRRFYVGIPSGWIFILTPWAIHFFLRGPAAGGGALHQRFHLRAPGRVSDRAGGHPGRGRADAALAGAGGDGRGHARSSPRPTPIHFLGNLAWYRGQARGDGGVARAADLRAGGGGRGAAAAPAAGRTPFLVAWLAAPAAWLVQDYTRFLLQATLALAVVGALELARLRRTAVVAGIVVLANLFPLEHAEPARSKCRGCSGCACRASWTGANTARWRTRWCATGSPAGWSSVYNATQGDPDRGLRAGAVRARALGGGAAAGRSRAGALGGGEGLCRAHASGGCRCWPNWPGAAGSKCTGAAASTQW